MSKRPAQDQEEKPFKKPFYPPKNNNVPLHHEDRQWDARFNVQLDEDLNNIVDHIKACWDQGKLKYILIGGMEIGTRPYQNDYGIRHVHVAAIFYNRISKRAILRNWNVKEGNGYYLVPRNRDLPYSGWRNHHTKDLTKVDPESTLIYEAGTLPADPKEKLFTKRSEEEKKRTVDEILIELRTLIELGKEDDAFKLYPRTYLQYGEKLKSLLVQKREFFKNKGDPHIWLYGFPGTGKTSILNLVYPGYYKKNLDNKFFDLYDPRVHSHVLLEDLDHKAMENLGVHFVKTICDEAGFAVDQKYKTPQLSRTTVLVTSNFKIDDILDTTHAELGAEQNKEALRRRFWHVNIYELLRLLGLKLLSKPERDYLRRLGNDDVRKIYITWDYLTDTPLGLPLKEPEEYQEIIKDAYYARR